ncbi:hypothetical protein LJR153_005758 [Paenibacillus sp. LjRoot153]|uniref:hypothetical protein n=1 Tax=Paenibacillus sp. LjRoot153 TaxID=3342270 RepID=UPI003ED07F1D
MKEKHLRQLSQVFLYVGHMLPSMESGTDLYYNIEVKKEALAGEHEDFQVNLITNQQT